MAKMTQYTKLINKERRDDRMQNRESEESGPASGKDATDNDVSIGTGDQQEPDDAPTDLAFGSGTEEATFVPAADVAPNVDDTADHSDPTDVLID